MTAFRLLLIVVMIAFAPLARAQDAAAKVDMIELHGIGSAPILLNPEILSKLPSVEKDVTFQTSKGPSCGRYKGVLFWDVLMANKAFDRLGHNEELARTFVVTGRDGYRIAFSVGEIHPDFGKVGMMVATEVDGKPFEDGLRIIVPGDRRGARNVREVATIELR